MNKTAEYIAKKAAVDEPFIWITDILSQPDALTDGKSTRVTFRIISLEKM